MCPAAAIFCIFVGGSRRATGCIMGYIDEYFECKKAIFYSDRIVLKKRKGNIVIERREIERLCYARPTFWNYLFAHANGLLPGQLVVWLKRPPQENKKAGYVLWIKYDDFLRIPFDIRLLTQLH